MLVPVHGNDVEKALRALKRKLQREGYFKDILARGFFEKPSERRRRKEKRGKLKRVDNQE